MQHLSSIFARLQVFFLPCPVLSQCYLGGNSNGHDCLLCWMGRNPNNASNCPESFNMSWTKPPPIYMRENEHYLVEYEMTIEQPLTVVPKLSFDGEYYDIVHTNLHSCWPSSLPCTPFVANAPGLSTHSPEQSLNFSKAVHSGSLLQTAKIEIFLSLPARAYTIIAHARFFVKDSRGQLLVYDAAIGTKRDVVRPASPAEGSNSSFPVVQALCIVSLILAFAIGVVLIYRRLKKAKKVSADLPDHVVSTTGTWLKKWIGPHIYAELCGRDMASLETIGVYNSRSSSSDNNSDKNFDKVRSSVSTVLAKAVTISSTITSSRLPSWIVNATPFNVQVIGLAGPFGGRGITLLRKSYSKVRSLSMQAITIKVENEPLFDWDRESEWLPSIVNAVHTVTLEDWIPCENSSSSRRIVRKDLQSAGDGKFCGQLKLVWRYYKVAKHGAVLLISWSPPHTLRGIPAIEFQQFLSKVINDDRVWIGMRSSRTSTSSNLNELIEKRIAERNMYDADKYIIKEEATHFDSSYAEIATQYGPPTVFVTHVWAETAETTQAGISKLWEVLLSSESVSAAGSARSRRLNRKWAYRLNDIKVWFCVACNNQARIQEELGDIILESPFAQVLRLPTVKTVALISPLKALVRKWCCFEFSIAVEMGLNTMMVTRNGIIQAGHVAPVELKSLAQAISTFDCKRAACSQERDEILIDAAIDEQGGYDSINNQVKLIFRQAIDEAHSHVLDAQQLLLEPIGLSDAKLMFQDGLQHDPFEARVDDPRQPSNLLPDFSYVLPSTKHTQPLGKTRIGKPAFCLGVREYKQHDVIGCALLSPQSDEDGSTMGSARAYGRKRPLILWL